jgi:hypothetical protein
MRPPRPWPRELFTFQNESAADCWSIKTLKEQKLITHQNVVDFGPYFANNPGSPWGHLPGPQRTRFLACYGEDDSSPDDAVEKPYVKPKSCEGKYQSCVANIRAVSQCVSDDYPAACIKTCVDDHGKNYDVCASSLCQPTPLNLNSWKKVCMRKGDRERDKCKETREDCLAQE